MVELCKCNFQRWETELRDPLSGTPSQATHSPASGSERELATAFEKASATASNLSAVYTRVPPHISWRGKVMVRRSYWITRPKLFPPPCKAQYKSVYDDGETVMILP